MKIKTVLLTLEKNPFTGKKLEGELQDQWSCRAWPYRIIYEIRKKELVVLVVNIGQRKDVYK